MALQDSARHVVIVNDGKSESLEIDLDQYPETIVFARNRRLREQFWRKVFQGLRPDQPLQYLEIGCQEGSSTLWAMENLLTHPGSRATAIDIFQPGVRATLEHNMRLTGHIDKLDIKEGMSGEILRTLPLYSFDIIYIDGLHATFAVLEDAVLSWRLLKDGGIMVFDDYEWANRPDPLNRPKSAVDFFMSAYLGKYKLIGKEWQVAIQKTYPDGILDQYLPD